MLKSIIVCLLSLFILCSVAGAADGCPQPFFEKFNDSAFSGKTLDEVVGMQMNGWPDAPIAEVVVTSTRRCRGEIVCVSVDFTRVFLNHPESSIPQKSGTVFDAYPGDPQWKVGDRFVALFVTQKTGSPFSILWALPSGDATENCLKNAIQKHTPSGTP